MRAWILDTGPLVAYLNPSEKQHARVVARIEAFTGQLLTTTAVITEAMHLVATNRRGPSHLAEFVSKSGLQVFDFTEAVALAEAAHRMEKYANVPMERVIVTVQKYGNMSAATVPVGLVDALHSGRVKPGSLLLMPGFGGGLTYGALLVRWGSRVTPLGTSSLEFPPLTHTALELVNDVRTRQDPNGRSLAGLKAPTFAEARLAAARV